MKGGFFFFFFLTPVHLTGIQISCNFTEIPGGLVLVVFMLSVYYLICGREKSKGRRSQCGSFMYQHLQTISMVLRCRAVFYIWPFMLSSDNKARVSRKKSHRSQPPLKCTHITASQVKLQINISWHHSLAVEHGYEASIKFGCNTGLASHDC